MKKIKTNGILLNAKFEGNGCVNNDSTEQAFYLHKIGVSGVPMNGGKFTENVSYAKKSFYPDGDGNVGFKYKVSSECIRHAMFKDEMDVQVNENVMQIPMVLYNAISTPAMIERGYMYTGGKGNPQTIKKKSVVTVTDAIEDTDTLRYSISTDLHTKSVKKENTSKSNAESDEDVKGSTSMYYIENVGECSYKSDMYIDLNEMQFISFDETYDRSAVNLDVKANEVMYLDALKRNFPDFNGKVGYYYMKNGYTKDEWAEKGLLLGENDVDFLTKDMIKRILNIGIYKRNAMFRISSLVLSYYDENGNVKNEEVTLNNINDFCFIPSGKYNEADENLIIENKNKYEEIVASTTKKGKKSSK